MKKITAPKDLKSVAKEIVKWCELSEVAVVEQTVEPSAFRVRGKKAYKSKAKFSWGIAVALFVLGVILGGAANASGADAEAGAVIMMCLPVGIYTALYFSKARPKEIQFLFAGSSEGTETEVIVELEPESDEAASEVNSLAMKYL